MSGLVFGQARHSGFYAIHRTDRPGRYRVRFFADGGNTTDPWLMVISREGGSTAVSSAAEVTPGGRGGISSKVTLRLRGDRTLQFTAIGPDEQRVRLSLRRTWP
jgi:hypothetical protein